MITDFSGRLNDYYWMFRNSIYEFGGMRLSQLGFGVVEFPEALYVW